MHEIRYMISDASKRIDVEQHTLRYWEEELTLHIPRNEMGHRYYREEDVEMLKAVKILKDQGYQLRAIKMLLPEIQKMKNLDKDDMSKIKQEWDKKYLDAIAREDINSESITGIDKEEMYPMENMQLKEKQADIMIARSMGKLDQFKAILNGMIAEALLDNNEILAESVSENVTHNVIKEIDYLLRIKEEREEERYKQFDRTLREMQSGRSEVAASRFNNKKKKKVFHKKSSFNF